MKAVKIVARQMALTHLRTFLEIVAQEEWLPFTKIRLIYNTDMPKSERHSPRFIPETVMAQLKEHLSTLPGHYQRLIFILMETGRRISEILTLPYDCMQQDEDNSYFLLVSEHKTKKSYHIPITDACATAIKEQQAHHLRIKKQVKDYLFIAHTYSTTGHLTARNVHNVLNNLAKEKNIRDENGIIWHFSTHQFRHTVGTRMINAGVSQTIVQRFLGHESPEMTSRYAYIHDCTLKEAFFKFQGNLVNVHGESTDTRIRKQEEKWLKHNVMAQALPNGYCGLPAKQQRCPHANACLTCANFRTDETFLPHHEQQLKATHEIIDNAKKCGWQRQAEMNQEIKVNLENIIAALRAKRHEPA
ncbi:MAG: tyrosine-type recombinase/integrase [Gammaproteobacteria bacterium]